MKKKSLGHRLNLSIKMTNRRQLTFFNKTIKNKSDNQKNNWQKLKYKEKKLFKP